MADGRARCDAVKRRTTGAKRREASSKSGADLDGAGSHAGRALECMAGEDVSGGFRTNGGKGLKLSGLTDERLKFCSVQRDSTAN